MAIGGDEPGAAKASPGEEAHRAVAAEEVSAGHLDLGAGELLLLVAEAVRERGARALRKRDEHVASKGLRVGREGLDVDAPEESRPHEALPRFRNRRRRERLAGLDGDETPHRRFLRHPESREDHPVDPRALSLADDEGDEGTLSPLFQDGPRLHRGRAEPLVAIERA